MTINSMIMIKFYGLYTFYSYAYYSFSLFTFSLSHFTLYTSNLDSNDYPGNDCPRGVNQITIEWGDASSIDLK